MKNKIFTFTNTTYAFIYRILLLYVLYFTMRICFFLFNYEVFQQANFGQICKIFAGGLVFDTSAIIYTNILFILLSIVPLKIRYTQIYQKIIAIIYYIFNSIAIILNMGDIIYYRFTLRRTTASVFSEFSNENNKLKIFFNSLVDYWYIGILIIVLITGMIWLYKLVKTEHKTKLNNWFYYGYHTLLALIIMVMSIAGMRGNLLHRRPITLSHASKYIDKPEHRALVLNTPFAVIRTFGKKGLKYTRYIDEDKVHNYFNPIHLYGNSKDSLINDSTKRYTTTTSPYYGKLKNRNIVILIWESGAREFTGFFNRKTPGYESYTPFLDSLARKSYTFDRAYANGRISIDAMPSILASIPRNGDCFVLSKYSGNKINSPASLLGPEGYRSIFTHGADNGSMGFDAFVKQCGFQDYYGMTEYNNDEDYDGNWGIWDEPFLQFTASIQDTLTQPFISATFTVTSHHPFNIPKKYEGKFPEGKIPFHKAIGYSDYSIKKYFETVSKKSWFNNTLFIITADHSTIHYEDSYKNIKGDYAIPMVLYAPGSNLEGHDTTTIVQQCDILPTIMSLVGYDKPFISFGHDMLNPSAKHEAFYYANGYFQYVEGDYLLQFDGTKTKAIYNTHKDPLLSTNIINTLPKRQKSMEKMIKAYLQTNLYSIINNKLYYKLNI